MKPPRMRLKVLYSLYLGTAILIFPACGNTEERADEDVQCHQLGPLLAALVAQIITQPTSCASGLRKGPLGQYAPGF